MKQSSIEASFFNEAVTNLYFNEIQFYQNIWKTLEKFQKKFPRSQPFDKLCKCYAAINEVAKEKIVMEDLKVLGYQLVPRSDAYNEQQIVLLLKLYGHFHGISAAFRQYNPEEFKSLTQSLKNSTESVFTIPAMRLYITVCCNHMYELVENESVKEKLGIYYEKCTEKALNSIRYDGKNPVLNHGDCWSNNIMLKYDVSNSQSIFFQ